MAKSIDTVYMVEASPELRQAQKDLLCGPDAELTKTEAGNRSQSKYGAPIVWSEGIKSVPAGMPIHTLLCPAC